MQKPNLLVLSQNAIFDMGQKSGKEVVYRTLQGLSEYFQVDIIAPGEPINIGDGRFYSLSSTWFNRLKSIKYIGHLFNYFYVFYLLFVVRKVVKNNGLQPDVVYLAGPWMSYIGHRLFKNSCPIVNRYYGVNWKPEQHHSMKQRLRFWMKHLGYKQFGNLVIMTNDGTRGDEFLLQLNCPKQSLRFWRNGVRFPSGMVSNADAKLKLHEKWGIPVDAKIILSVSRLAAWKRINLTINALPKTLEIEPNTYFLVVGDGEERASLERLSRELNVQEQVIFAGSIPGEKLSEIYASADVFVSMYAYSNAGNPLFEAMMHACPIVTLHSEVMHSFLPEDAGVLLNDHSPETIALALVDLLQHPAKRIALGIRA
jgi:glycosyltransferase involved in cell wall biosynthesis